MSDTGGHLRVGGHGLRSPKRTTERALCTCGWESEPVRSKRHRSAVHREHKWAVVRGVAE